MMAGYAGRFEPTVAILVDYEEMKEFADFAKSDLAESISDIEYQSGDDEDERLP